MNKTLHGFWQDEDGQDVIEYTLLLSFVCLAAVCQFRKKPLWDLGSHKQPTRCGQLLCKLVSPWPRA